MSATAHESSSAELPPIAAPLTDQEWPEAVAHLRSGFAGKLNVYRVMAHHPALLRSWETLRNHVVLNSALTPIQREIIILRVGHRWGSRYEWAQHVVRGRQAGLSDVQIENARLDATQWRAERVDVLLMQAVDTLLDQGELAPTELNELEQQLGREAVFDVMATVGMYTTLAFIVKSFRTPVEPDIAAALGQLG